MYKSLNRRCIMSFLDRFRKPKIELPQPTNAFEYAKAFKTYYEDGQTSKAIKIGTEFYDKYTKNYCANCAMGMCGILLIADNPSSSQQLEAGRIIINQKVDPVLKELKDNGLPSLPEEQQELLRWFDASYNITLELVEAKFNIKIRDKN